MSVVFTGTLAKTLKANLDSIIDDDTDGVGTPVLEKYCAVEGMEDAYEDELETAGPGIAGEVYEGEEYPTGAILEGYVTRYTARKFGLRMGITEEAAADNKYASRTLKAARRLKRAIYKAAELEAGQILNRMFNTAYTGGDDLCLGNASHTVPNGGTFSNVMATPLAPSRAALIILRAQAAKLVGHDGVIGDNYMLEKIVCPIDQQSVWEGILGSSLVPETNANEINVANRMKLELVPVVYWTASTTNYALMTDAGDGLKFKWRQKPFSKSWVDEPVDTMWYKVGARWARGWSNPRAIICVQA